MTKSQTVTADIAALLRARNAVQWIVTREEARVEAYLIEAAGKAGYGICFWDCAKGVTQANGQPASAGGSTDPSETLGAIAGNAQDGTTRRVWVMRDLHKWLEGPIGIQTSRQLRNLARSLPATPREKAQAIIVLSPSAEVPPELAGNVTVIDWPLPDRDEIAKTLDDAIAGLPEDIRASAAPNGTREAAIDAAVGLSGDEASSCYAKSLVQLRRIDPATVATEKKRVIARERVLEWMEPLKGGFDAVGGLDVVKTWTTGRMMAYTPAARAYGLPSPRGIFLVGVSGCGKTYIAKAIASVLQGPLLRLDPGALKSKFVGESEANFRKALATIESVGRCVVLVDEIEKALAGATQGAADGGVSADTLGALLTWMQERTSPAFIVATSNDVTGLPPELLRKGRWDELFWVDLPNLEERKQILGATLRMYGRDPEALDLDGTDWLELARLTDKFTGAEIAALVPEALFGAFADNGREIGFADLARAAKSVVPLAETSKEKIAAMRAWSKGRARPATTPDSEKAQTTGRLLDV